MKNLIVLKPYLDQKIWGGNILKKIYNSNLPNIGEALIISALKNKSSQIISNNYKGMDLYDFYNKNKDFFNNSTCEFPLLTKIIDANQDLSIQLHPDDNYARIHHNKYGKTECWYILEACPNAQIIYGHKCKNKEELLKALENNSLEEKLIKINVKKGDFFYVPPGTIHAIGKGILIFELQQSSDITYRLYDYNRIDKTTNKLRELHIKESLDVVKIPYEDLLSKYNLKSIDNNELFFESEYFKLKILNLDKPYFQDSKNKWIQGTILNGDCFINNELINSGFSFISRFNNDLNIVPNKKCTVLLSWI